MACFPWLCYKKEDCIILSHAKDMSSVQIYSGQELESLTGSVTVNEVKALWGKDKDLAEIRLDFAPHVYYVLVLGDDNGLAGLTRLVQLGTKSKKYAVLHDVVVDETYRGQGLANLLMEAIIQFGKDKQLDYLELTCRPSREAANHLYTKHGFQLLAAAVPPDGTNYYRYLFQ
jgi:ribosomal protein S18 acetylase RimI-like enzyme